MKLHKNSIFTLGTVILRKQAECGDRGHPSTDVHYEIWIPQQGRN